MSANTWRQWLRWLAPVAILVVVLVVLRDQMPFFGEAWRAVRGASIGPLLLSVATAVLSLAAMSGVMQILLNVEGRITGVARTNAIVFASNAWSTTVPGGPALSAWLTFRVHRSWGASVGLCGWFFVVSGALSTVWMVLIGLVAVVFLGASLSVTTLVSTLALTLLVIAGMFWATRNPDILTRWARYLPPSVRDRVTNVIQQVSQIRMSTGQFVTAAFFSLCNRLLDLVVLFFCVWAVLGTPPGTQPGLNEASLMGVTLAFIMTKLAGAAQVTPGGIGTVEPVATASLVASGLTLVDATAATLIYRIISFALITAIGWVIYLVAYAGKGFMLGHPGDGHLQN